MSTSHARSPGIEVPCITRLGAPVRLDRKGGEIGRHLDGIARAIADLLEADWTLISLVEGGIVRVLATTREFEPRAVSLHGTVGERVVRERRPVIVEDSTAALVEGAMPEGYTAYLGLPMRSGLGDVIGTVCSFHATRRRFSDAQISTAQVLAEAAARAIECSRLQGRPSRPVTAAGSPAGLFRAEDALRQSEAAFRALVERCPEPIFVHRRGILLYVNPALAAGCGFLREELIGRSLLETVVHPGDREMVERRFHESASADSPLPALEVRFRRRDGTVRIAETVSVRIDYESEGAVLVIGRDITDRKQMQSRLMISDRMASIGTLAAGIAHEINNPLAYVMGQLESVSEEIRALSGSSSSERLRRMEQGLRQAQTGVDRIARIVRGLRLFSRADEERRGPIDPHVVLELAINMSFNEIRHRARLVRELGRLPLVDADEARLCQVFVNLLVNAAQAIAEGNAGENEIHVVTSTDEAGRAVIEVRDTGCGISPETRDRIFLPFFTTKPVGVGTGLGLSICHGIVTGMGGEIGVESEPGRGSTFRVALPPARLGPVAVERQPRVVPATRRGRVLVIDDDADIAGVTAQMIADHDVAVTLAGREALERIEAGEAFDAVICDLMMPEMSGMDLYELAVQARPELAQRFIFVTGGAFTPRASAFLEHLRCPVLEKPFRKDQLRSRLHALLG